ncbi:MAG: hypothetical protein WHT82_14355, partial [Limisphaera sp.]
EQLEYDTAEGRIRIGLGPADPFTPAAYLRIETTGPGPKAGYQLAGSFTRDREAWRIPLNNNLTWIELTRTSR